MGVDHGRAPTAAGALVDQLVVDRLVMPGAIPRPLSGGVSCDVWRIDATYLTEELAAACPYGIVVKRALPTLRVPDPWHADVSRAGVEATALELLATLTPQRVPSVVWRSPDATALAVEAAPLTWEDWRAQLLRIPVHDPRGARLRLVTIGTRLGTVLATWHNETVDTARLPADLLGSDRLRTLRTDPFHRTVAAAIPEVESELRALADAIEARRVCLVHGDFSPKNVLLDGGASTTPDVELWVVDAETAHVGDPVLDVAFLDAHLLLKALARPHLRESLQVARAAFAAEYLQGSSLVDRDLWSQHAGAILAARVCGTSRVGYLSDSAQEWVVQRAARLIQKRSTIAATWHALPR